MKTLRSYNLCEYLTEYLKSGFFPSKYKWKSIVNNAVYNQQSDNWRKRINVDDDFVRFRNIHKTISMPTIWKHANSRAEIVHS